jgi:hypothetical protein
MKRGNGIGTPEKSVEKEIKRERRNSKRKKNKDE